ncbi:phospholipid scramblase 1 isoform X1 [Tupaia chinensis]|uniref:phospholipid scramblase 1 isoform X1 n=1 Tax=Tupaia chinensis TaxID=246437 RepID=UPI00070458BB|nr:phospholipid scramblase 1 isoform X1 [Tupaia chinensis]
MAKQIPSGLPKTEAASPHMVPAAYVQSQPGYQRPGDAAQMPWMPVPPAHLNCPPGLEYLTLIDTILIHQQVEPLELLTGFETANKYEIRNRLGERIYFAVEYNDCCTRNCCGYSRPFTMKIMDNMRREVIILERPLRCNSCFCPCCLQKIEIQAPPGVPIGYISQKWHPYLPKFTIQNEQKEDVMKIIGPCLMCSCCGNVDFEIRSLDETTVLGRISKHWSGILKEVFTDTDDFGVYFALDLDVKMKAVMIGACLLIVISKCTQNSGTVGTEQGFSYLAA